ncbi:hypothetical protein AB0L53_47935 [Nonomuraea sp. NPDC052129]|uniref:hypothetical protein n=1 Tax=Nonomuraea sp. NPDC052129 TaxID=3154651 RepID=UPI00343C48E6
MSGELMTESTRRRLSDRDRVLREIALLVSDDPRLAAACTSALLGTRSGRSGAAAAHRQGHPPPPADRAEPRCQTEASDARILHALEFAYAGALVHAGMGYSSYADMADRLAGELLL